MKMVQVETFGKFVVRKTKDICSGIYRSIIYPFIRMGIERRTGSIIEINAFLRNGCKLEGCNYICEGAQLDNAYVGYGSMVGRFSKMSNVRIGKYCSIGGAETYIGRHPVKGENISIHPAFYSTGAQYGFTYVAETSFKEVDWIDEENGIAIDIGNDVWIGKGVAILDGVKIGDGAVIGAGSLVNRNVEPYAIYGGTPARKIGERFPKETVEKLIELKWWNKDETWIRENAVKFSNSVEFIGSL